jgi:hypothetical protein
MNRPWPLLFLLAACNPSRSPSPTPSATPPTATVTAAGAPVPASTAVPIADVLAAPDRFAGKTLVIDGHVRAACKKKGCWMEIGARSGGPACRVRFKDYGFFVPTDSAGADVRLSGEVGVRTLAKDEVAHLEGEGATLAKAEDGSAKVVEITATGVELSRL